MKNDINTILAFALSHDWGRDAYIFAGAVVFYDEDNKPLEFTDLQSLRIWAGY